MKLASFNVPNRPLIFQAPSNKQNAITATKNTSPQRSGEGFGVGLFALSLLAIASAMGSWWQAKLIENSANLVAKDIALELLKTSSPEKKINTAEIST